MLAFSDHYFYGLSARTGKIVGCNLVQHSTEIGWGWGRGRGGCICTYKWDTFSSQSTAKYPSNNQITHYVKNSVDVIGKKNTLFGLTEDNHRDYYVVAQFFYWFKIL